MTPNTFTLYFDETNRIVDESRGKPVRFWVGTVGRTVPPDCGMGYDEIIAAMNAGQLIPLDATSNGEPARVWVDDDEKNGGDHRRHSIRPFETGVEYIAASAIASTIRAARVAGMQERDVHWAEMFDEAVQGDCENGVRSLNEIAARNYLKEAPLTREVINAIRAAADKLEAVHP